MPVPEQLLMMSLTLSFCVSIDWFPLLLLPPLPTQKIQTLAQLDSQTRDGDLHLHW